MKELLSKISHLISVLCTIDLRLAGLSGGGGNFFNADLVADADHTHDGGGFATVINNLSGFQLVSNGDGSFNLGPAFAAIYGTGAYLAAGSNVASIQADTQIAIESGAEILLLSSTGEIKIPTIDRDDAVVEVLGYDEATGFVYKTAVATLGNAIISPSQITSDQDNYNPTGIESTTHLRISGDNGIRAITGIDASAITTLQKIILNIGSYPIYFPMDHPDSTSTNRFTGNSGDFILHPGMSVTIWYDTTSTKWRIIGEMNSQGKRGVFHNWAQGSVTAGDNHEIEFGGTINLVTATATLPYAATLSTGASSTGQSYALFVKANPQFTYVGSSHIYIESLISLPILSTSGERYTIELQLKPGGGAFEENNSFGIRYSDDINSGKFELFAQDNSGTEVVADLGITVAASTLYVLRAEIDKANGDIRAYIDGVFVGRVASNLTANAVFPRLINLKSVGTTARILNMHSFSAGAIYP